jgi:deoxyribose-phosphate aldolase
MIQIPLDKLAAAIDHTLLKPEATRKQIQEHCDQAQSLQLGAVCILPRWVPLAADLLQSGPVRVATVVGFPLGADTTAMKAAQAKEAIHAGADEIDMVADLASIIEGDTQYLLNQCRAVLRICRSMRPPVLLKVIIECAALTQEQKIVACHTLQRVQVDFIKTSTGLHPAGGATLEDIRLIKAEAPACKIKAAGGIRTVDQVLAMMEAGAARIGTSAGVTIIREYQTRMGL